MTWPPLTFVTRLFGRLAEARERRDAIELLRSFDHAQLSDLGITRDEIPAYVDGKLEKQPALPPLNLHPRPARQGNVIPFPGACCVPALERA
ncbi:MAG: DUF1127 domain-containing protein [Pseudomonadota bacterium]